MTKPVPFSEQLRRAVDACGTSRYALAKHLGVAESSLSRFMAGRQGLALPTLDRLVELLGLELIGTVQRVPRAGRRGRKKAVARPPEKEKAKMTKKDWAEFAAACARDAHDNYFESRRGTWHFEDEGVVVLFNNNPYVQHPTLRDEELAEFRERLRTEGIRELAYATFPPEDGYTYALVLEAGRDREEHLADLMREIVRKTVVRGLVAGG
jgi:transcriptional regulator with XRE-family HTH domain